VFVLGGVVCCMTVRAMCLLGRVWVGDCSGWYQGVAHVLGWLYHGVGVGGLVMLVKNGGLVAWSRVVLYGRPRIFGIWAYRNPFIFWPKMGVNLGILVREGLV